MSNTTFNPLRASRSITNRYRTYMATTNRIADEELQRQYEKELAQPQRLSKGPFLEATPPHTTDRSVRQLVEEGLLCRSMLNLGNGNTDTFDLDRPLYVHQCRAIEKASKGRNYAVITGTGSGKTECFILPIINDILSEFEQDGASAGVRAIILYPMNALANDQLERLRKLLKGTEITFGRYTGETPETTEQFMKNGNKRPLRNELVSREEMRKTPPNILLTNYSMLEYLLLRPKDAPLFEKAIGDGWRHLAIDEAHVYSGALGTEIAYLLRRLKARVAVAANSEPHPHCYLTSATIGDESETPLVARFAQELTGEPFSQEPEDLDVIIGVQDDILDGLPTNPTWSLASHKWVQLRDALDDEPIDGSAIAAVVDGEAPTDIVANLTRSEDALVVLGRALLSEERVHKLISLCAEDVIDLSDHSLREELGDLGVAAEDEATDILTSMVEVLAKTQRSPGIPVLSCRYHTFLAAPDGAYLNLSDHTISLDRSTVHDSTPVYEIGVCRHCGGIYLTGEEKGIEGMPGRSWLSPVINANDDGEVLPRQFYRLIGEEGALKDEVLQWLCPTCGSLHSEPEGGVHRFPHEDIARIPVALVDAEGGNYITCVRCGGSRAIRRFRMAPEVAGALVCHDLLREIPPFTKQSNTEPDPFSFDEDDGTPRAGSTICFSDNRQDAAYFAPRFDDDYARITRRQLLRQAIEARDGEDPATVAEQLETLMGQSSTLSAGGAIKDRAMAIVLGEMTSSTPRNSLEGLGIVSFKPTVIEGMLGKRTQIKILKGMLAPSKAGCLSEDELRSLILTFFNRFRTEGALDIDKAVADRIDSHRHLPTFLSKSVTSDDNIAFVSKSKQGNWFSDYLRRYVEARTDASMTTEEAQNALNVIWKLVGSLLNALPKKGLCLKHGEQYRLSPELWTCHAVDDEDDVLICDVCGRMAITGEGDPCPTYRCRGTMSKVSDEERRTKDIYYRNLYQEDPLAARTEEHTAQLSTEEARRVQEGFLDGSVNILSCTTTFELGVDVGDLRAVFMRNVPPSPANYAQRAGRVGRRAGKPGFAVTYCRYRPHDRAFFNDPKRIIKGRTAVPAVFLENEEIAKRHVNAVALSEFFRANYDGTAMLGKYQDFLDLTEDVPGTMRDLERFIKAPSWQLERQLELVFGDARVAAKAIGIPSGTWQQNLIVIDDDGTARGRIAAMHEARRSDYRTLERKMTRTDDPHDRASINRAMDSLRKPGTIDELASSGVIPKYGFPTDLVSLWTPYSSGNFRDNHASINLQRGLRRAISEFAPGAEVVAKKKRFMSVGIRKPSNQELQERNYGVCANCGTFLMPISGPDNATTCPTCHEEVSLSNRALIPAFGFTASEERGAKVISKGKPKPKGYSEIYYSRDWEAQEQDDVLINLPGGDVRLRYSTNGELFALNDNGGGGFHMCKYCHGAGDSRDAVKHMDWCENKRSTTRYRALGSIFHSAVLEITPPSNTMTKQLMDWESAMWAVMLSAAEMLNIPEGEIGATCVPMTRPETILLFDDVPGGAGHVARLKDKVPELLEQAWERVADCTCGPETCCYSCIATYRNQRHQGALSRIGAMKVLGPVLGKVVPEDERLAQGI